jgi:hypothetical protein
MAGFGLLKVLLAGAVASGTLLAAAGAALAHDDRRDGYGRRHHPHNWRPPVHAAPGYYVAPPPVQYLPPTYGYYRLPPPVYYVPPPPVHYVPPPRVHHRPPVRRPPVVYFGAAVPLR